MASLAAAPVCAATPAKPCRYVRLGGMPAQWIDSRLRVEGSIEHTPEPMILDTGAGDTQIPEDIAHALSLERVRDVRFVGYGIGGQVAAWVATVKSITVGDVSGQNVHLIVDRSKMPGVLVGADFLFQHDLELDGGRATSFAPLDCGDAPLAYWAPDVPWVEIEPPDGDDRRVVVPVRVNGQAMRALVDTGSPVSILNIDAARRLNLDAALASAPVDDIGGIGRKRTPVWSVPIDAFAIGDEQVQHTRLLVGDLWGHERADRGLLSGWWYTRHAPELVLGADFLQAHRLLFAMKQRRLYFTYLGGDLFNVRTEGDGAAPAPASASAGG